MEGLNINKKINSLGIVIDENNEILPFDKGIENYDNIDSVKEFVKLKYNLNNKNTNYRENLDSFKKYADIEKIKEILYKDGFELIGEREQYSGGAMGNLFRLKIRDIKNSQEKFILERAFCDRSNENGIYSTRFDVIKKNEIREKNLESQKQD